MSESKVYDYRGNFPIDPDAKPTSSEAKTPFCCNGSGPFSRERYYSERRMKREKSYLWAKVWNWAGHEEDWFMLKA